MPGVSLAGVDRCCGRHVGDRDVLGRGWPPAWSGEPPTYLAEIRRTAYGVPHVEAGYYGGLGFGLGYAFAEDNFREYADRLLTTSGQRVAVLRPW